MGVAVSKISMLTHCQALTQACNYCEGQNVVLFADCVSALTICSSKSRLKVLKQFTGVFYHFCLRGDTGECSGL